MSGEQLSELRDDLRGVAEAGADLIATNGDLWRHDTETPVERLQWHVTGIWIWKRKNSNG